MELYTIGYEGLNEKSFLAWLNRYHISIVADVRQIPLSRKKGFSKTALNKILSKHNINYINFQSLGTGYSAQIGHSFRSISATCSGAFRPPVPE